MVNKRIKKATDTKERILEATTLVVNRMGLRNATIDEIIQEAGISKGGFLYHFPTKTACLSALVDMIFDGMYRETLEKVEQMPDAPGRMLKAYIEVWLKWQFPPYNLHLYGIVEDPEFKNRIVTYRIEHYNLVLDKRIPDLVVQTVLLICAGLHTLPLMARATDEELAYFCAQMRDVMMEMIDKSVLPQTET